MIVCDSNVIFDTIKMGRQDRLKDQCTSALAVYELGNVVWKYASLAKTYSQKEANDLLSLYEIVLEDMRVVHSDLNHIYFVAEKYRTSFYDAAYLCLAKDMNLPLVTLDQKLANKASGSVKVVSFDQFIHG